MRAVRTIAAVLVTASIVVTGCAAYSGADRPSGPPPVSRPRPDRFDQARRDRQAQIYSAVLGQYLTTGALAEVGPLTFVASDEEVLVAPCARVRDDGILVTLGPVNGAGD